MHVIYYRAIRPGLIEIVRALHERMEPSRHVELETIAPLSENPPSARPPREA